MANDNHYHNGHGRHDDDTIPESEWQPAPPPADPNAPTQPLRQDDAPRTARPDEPTWPPSDELDAMLRAQADREAPHPPAPEVVLAYLRYNVQRLIHTLVETLRPRGDR